MGFAETATAIGARLAVRLHAYYIQTTREQIPGVSYLYFTEAHSHAAEQKLVKKVLNASLQRLLREPIQEMKRLDTEEEQEEYKRLVKQLFQI